MDMIPVLALPFSWMYERIRALAHVILMTVFELLLLLMNINRLDIVMTVYLHKSVPLATCENWAVSYISRQNHQHEVPKMATMLEGAFIKPTVNRGRTYNCMGHDL